MDGHKKNVFFEKSFLALVVKWKSKSFECKRNKIAPTSLADQNCRFIFFLGHWLSGEESFTLNLIQR